MQRLKIEKGGEEMCAVRSIERKVEECDEKCARMNEDLKLMVRMSEDLKTMQKNEERFDEEGAE